MNKKVIIAILCILICCGLGLGAYYYLTKNNNDDKLTPPTLKESDEKVITNSDDLKGTILDYEYEISYDCKSEANAFDLSLKGYYWNAYKMPDSPMFYYITAGEETGVRVNKISINKNDITLEIEELFVAAPERAGMPNPDDKNAFTNPACVKFTQNKGYPTINSITIKNQNGDAYQELNNVKKWDDNPKIDKTGTIEGSDIKYEISNKCDFSDEYFKTLDLSQKGYYIDTLNKPNAPYFYLITMGTKPNGCYSMNIKNIWVDGQYLKISVAESLPEGNVTCSDALVTPSKCVAIYNQGDKIIQIEEEIGDTIEVLNALN